MGQRPFYQYHCKVSLKKKNQIPTKCVGVLIENIKITRIQSPLLEYAAFPACMSALCGYKNTLNAGGTFGTVSNAMFWVHSSIVGISKPQIPTKTSSPLRAPKGFYSNPHVPRKSIRICTQQSHDEKDVKRNLASQKSASPEPFHKGDVCFGEVRRTVTL